MLRNYLVVAIRNIRKNRLYAFINIFGLTIGLAVCLLISFYVIDELRYDRFHSNVSTMYRVSLIGKLGDQEIQTSNTCPPMKAALESEISGVESATRIRTIGDIVFRAGDQSYAEEDIIYGDDNFFTFFSFLLLEGDPATVLKEPNSIVLTEELALKYFPDGNAVGELMTIGSNRREYKVTGVAANPPSYSHIKFKGILSHVTIEQISDSYNFWTNNFLYTYFRKNPNTPDDQVQEQMQDLVHKYVGDELAQFMGATLEEFFAAGNRYEYAIYPMTDTHLYSPTDDDMEANGDIGYVYIFSAVGLFILLIACINFMNLSTAKSAGRAKEVGLRKTLGSNRNTLVGQFLAESMVYSFAAMILALGVTYALLPQFNLVAGKALVFSTFNTPLLYAVLAVVALLVGFLAGSYPAFYLTAFKPAEVLRGKVKAGMKSGGVRSSLVVFQFWISIVLIICTGLVYNQLNYMQTKNLGIDRENVLVISSTGKLDDDIQAFRNAVDNVAEVTATSFSNNVFPGINNTTAFTDAVTEVEYLMGSYFADYEHAETLNLEIVEGRFFSRDFPSDSQAVVINQMAVREFGWEDPIGKEIVNYFNDAPQAVRVIGVVKDFNFESLKTAIRPLVINLTAEANNLMIKYNGNSASAVSQLETIWSEYAPGEPFEYAFLDENYDALFRTEQRLGQLFTMFTILAIFIASLGLFALASFMAEQRTKEIGIRKALGASLPSLTVLMSKEFTKLVMLAFVLAIIPTWYFMDKWLDGFVYRGSISIWVFVGAGVLALLTAWVTVGFQAVKAATANPVKSLKYE